MDPFQWFILGIIGFIFLAGCHRRMLRYRLIRHLQEDGKSPKEIEQIMRAYAGEEE